MYRKYYFDWVIGCIGYKIMVYEIRIRRSKYKNEVVLKF